MATSRVSRPWPCPCSLHDGGWAEGCRPGELLDQINFISKYFSRLVDTIASMWSDHESVYLFVFATDGCADARDAVVSRFYLGITIQKEEHTSQRASRHQLGAIKIFPLNCSFLSSLTLKALFAKSPSNALFCPEWICVHCFGWNLPIWRLHLNISRLCKQNCFY